MSKPHHASLLSLTAAIIACRSCDPDLRQRATVLRDQVLADIAEAEAAARAQPREPEPEILFQLALAQLPGSWLPFALLGERRGVELSLYYPSLAHAIAGVPAFVGRLMKLGRCRSVGGR